MDSNPSNVIAFPQNDPYVKFKLDQDKMDRFDVVMNDLMESIQKQFPDVAGYQSNDFVLVAESIMAMIMRAHGVTHPLNVFANTVTPEFAAEYCPRDLDH